MSTLPNSNTFLEFINNPVFNINNAIRYSTMYQAKIETLSTHIAEVSLMSYILCKHVISLGDNINIGECLEKCILHDLDEVYTGDIPRATKHYNEESLRSMEEVALVAVMAISNDLRDKVNIPRLWKEAKKGKEGIILNISDTLVVARKVINEVSLHGNISFLKVAIELKDHLKCLSNFISEDKNFNEFSRKYLYNLVYDSREAILDLLRQKKFEVQQYGIDRVIFKSKKVDEA